LEKKIKMAAKNQDGVRWSFFNRNSTETPPSGFERFQNGVMDCTAISKDFQKWSSTKF
jgi:hypothetical protein